MYAQLKITENPLLSLIFIQIPPHLEEFVCTPRSICTPNLILIDVIVFSYKSKMVHRQTRQNEVITITLSYRPVNQNYILESWGH